MARDDDQDRQRFIKLAFCRADLLVELDDTLRIDFVAGATEPLLGMAPEGMLKGIFPSLLSDRDRGRISRALLTLPATGRMEETVVYLRGRGGIDLRMVMAGYRAKDFDDHIFLTLKVAPPPEGKLPEGEAPPLRGKGDFEKAATARMAALRAQGGHPQLSLLQLNGFQDVMKTLGASTARLEFVKAISRILGKVSLGGDSAGDLGEGRFSVVHDESVSVTEIGDAIEAESRRLGPAGETLTVAASTMDLDADDLTEEQTAKALAYTIKQFCAKGSQGVPRNLGQAITVMMSKTLDTVGTLRRIIRKGELDLAYMPICDMRLGKVHHFEVLTRFRHPDYQGSPYPLITLAEEMDLICDLDMAVAARTLEALKGFKGRAPLPPLAVNLSGKSINNAAFIDGLLKLLAASGLPPGKLMFEITESAQIDNLPNVNAVIQNFRGKGYKFALDDFGAGAASFDYLNALDADYVKFDGPVVRRACGTAKGNDLLSTMAKMCSHNKIFTIAEMIEDKAMANQVYYCGIDFGQGWHFGKADSDPYKFAKDFVGAE